MTQPYPLTGTLPTPDTRKRLPLRLRSNGLPGDQEINGRSPRADFWTGRNSGFTD